MFLSEAVWRERLRRIPVHCCVCVAAFHGAGLPSDPDYPLSVGICAACWRLIRRPNHLIVRDNVSLQEENERLREALCQIEATRNTRHICKRHGGDGWAGDNDDECWCGVSLDAENKMRQIARAALHSNVR